jgi:acyl carrier protein
MKEQPEIFEWPAIETEVKGFILANFLPGEDERNLKEDDLLFESGIIDSAGAMTFIAFLEQSFNIEVMDEELFPENFATVSHIIKFVEGKLKERLAFRQKS